MKNIIIILFFVIISQRIINAQVTFYPATPENTTLQDGSPVINTSSQSGWKWIPDIGNKGVFQSNKDSDAPVIIIKINKLNAGKNYIVYGYFWDNDTKNKNQQICPAKFGISVAKFAIFSGKNSPNMPWIISPESKHGIVAGLSATIASGDNTNFINGENYYTKDNKILVQARLGVSRADKNGTILVFADDFPGGINYGMTEINGVGIQTATDKSETVAGSVADTNLHLAIRSGDWVSFERELVAGANVNAIDHSGLTPLFYASVSGNKDIAKKLINLHADPNLREQAILPLTAAASLGDVEMVRLLLASGAEIPTKRMEAGPNIKGEVDPSLLHPAIAAIDVGSLEVLKLILDKKPELNLENLGPDLDPLAPSASILNSQSKFLIQHAVSKGNDELAAFLIDRGCSLHTKTFGSDQHGYVFEAHDSLLVRSITEGDTLKKTREAIYRRGVKLVYPSWRSHINELSNSQPYSIEPWDALSAAIKVGNTQIVSSLVTKANQLPKMDQIMLAALAQDSGDRQILEMVSIQVPEAFKIIKTDNKSREGNMTNEDLRLLIPRTKSKPKNNNVQSVVKIAVINSQNAEDIALLIESKASKINKWSVVDRSFTESALKERSLKRPWESGEHNLADFGDNILADSIIIVSNIANNNINLICVEVIDVNTGLPLMRGYIEKSEFNNEDQINNLLIKIKSSIDQSMMSERPLAITILPFAVSEKILLSKVYEKNLSLAVQAEIDATPGIISVSTAQMRSVSNEQNLKGKEQFWAASYTVEGGIQPLNEKQILLSLRISSTNPSDIQNKDYTVEGLLSEIPNLVSRVWSEFLKSRDISNKIQAETHVIRNNSEEAKKLLREAQWLLQAQDPERALNLVERAIYLGAKPEDYIDIHLHCLAAKIDFAPQRWDAGRGSTVKTRFPIVNNGTSLSDIGWHITPHTLSLDFQSRLIKSLSASEDLLHHASHYFEQHGSTCQKWKYRDESFWDSMLLLSYIRSSLPILMLKSDDKSTFELFCADLDKYTKSFFE